MVQQGSWVMVTVLATPFHCIKVAQCTSTEFNRLICGFKGDHDLSPNTLHLAHMALHLSKHSLNCIPNQVKESTRIGPGPSKVLDQAKGLNINSKKHVFKCMLEIVGGFYINGEHGKGVPLELGFNETIPTETDAGACVSPDILIHDAGSSLGGASVEGSITVITQM